MIVGTPWQGKAWKRAVATSALLTIATTASAFDFKGLTLGEQVTVAQVEAVFAACVPFRGTECSDSEQMIHDRLKVTCGQGAPGRAVCNGWTTIAGFRAKANIVIGLDGALQRVWLTEINPSSFDELHNQLASKFGRPRTSDRSRVQNAFGAQYQQAEYEWSDRRGRRVVLRKYAGRVDESSVMFDTPEDRAMLNERRSKNGDL